MSLSLFSHSLLFILTLSPFLFIFPLSLFFDTFYNALIIVFFILLYFTPSLSLHYPSAKGRPCLSLPRFLCSFLPSSSRFSCLPIFHSSQFHNSSTLSSSYTYCLSLFQSHSFTFPYSLSLYLHCLPLSLHHTLSLLEISPYMLLIISSSVSPSSLDISFTLSGFVTLNFFILYLYFSPFHSSFSVSLCYF